MKRTNDSDINWKIVCCFLMVLVFVIGMTVKSYFFPAKLDTDGAVRLLEKMTGEHVIIARKGDQSVVVIGNKVADNIKNESTTYLRHDILLLAKVYNENIILNDVDPIVSWTIFADYAHEGLTPERFAQVCYGKVVRWDHGAVKYVEMSDGDRFEPNYMGLITQEDVVKHLYM